MPADKIMELEEKFNRLEEKLRLTFIEIEKRLEQLQHPESNAQERIEELEDLLLLLQLENTKIKEKVSEGLDFGITPNVPDVSERLNRVEAELASHTAASVPAQDIDAKIASLEARINALQTGPVQVPEGVEKGVKAALSEDMRALEKKVKTLEALLAQRGHEELERDVPSVLADVQKLLKRA